MVPWIIVPLGEKFYSNSISMLLSLSLTTTYPPLLRNHNWPCILWVQQIHWSSTGILAGLTSVLHLKILSTYSFSMTQHFLGLNCCHRWPSYHLTPSGHTLKSLSLLLSEHFFLKLNWNCLLFLPLLTSTVSVEKHYLPQLSGCWQRRWLAQWPQWLAGCRDSFEIMPAASMI